MDNDIDETMRPALLVVGCSEQLPDQVRAYRVMGTASTGGLLLSRGVDAQEVEGEHNGPCQSDAAVAAN